MERATFAAGCFWGVEEAFRAVDGVIDARVGYTGGHQEEPTYNIVCSGGTGHAEAVEVTFAPEKVTYAELVERFFELHDPTTLNRQGPDIGEQYRSAIFFHDIRQELAARTALKKLNESGKLPRPAVTQILAAETFWPAEEYHQRYHEKQGGSCKIR